jgi:hypothetical protein
VAFPDICKYPLCHPGPCERSMGERIAELLRLFRARVPDAESIARVFELATNPDRWSAGHEVFNEVRDRVIAASKAKDRPKTRQHSFEELCCKAMYNASNPRDPFDPSSAFFVAGAAFALARVVGVSVQDVLAIIAPQGGPNTAPNRGVMRVYSWVHLSPAAATSTLGRSARDEDAAMGVLDLQQFPASHPGPYERNMGEEIAGLVRLFQGRVPDPASNARVLELAVTPGRWSAGHALFDILRDRFLPAMRAKDQVRCNQYKFEELCLQALYNATVPAHPFDSGSPFWVAGVAVRLARAVGVPEQAVVAVLAPDDRLAAEVADGT